MASPQNYDFESMGKIEMLEQDMSGLDDEDYTSDFLDAASGGFRSGVGASRSSWF